MTKKKTKSQRISLNSKVGLEKYVRKAGRKLKVFETLVQTQLMDIGLGTVLIAKTKHNGDVVVGNFLIDTHCCGVKDCMLNVLSPTEYEEYKAFFKSNVGLEFEEKDANWVYNLIYGAVEYAEDIGLEPDKSFLAGEYLLPKPEELTYEDIEFGLEGQPCYTEGTNDHNKLHVISMLEKNVGRGNFKIMIQGGLYDSEDEVDDEMDYADLDNYTVEDLLEYYKVLQRGELQGLWGDEEAFQDKLIETSGSQKDIYSVYVGIARHTLHAAAGDFEGLAKRYLNNYDQLLLDISQTGAIEERDNLHSTLIDNYPLPYAVIENIIIHENLAFVTGTFFLAVIGFIGDQEYSHDLANIMANFYFKSGIEKIDFLLIDLGNLREEDKIYDENYDGNDGRDVALFGLEEYRKFKKDSNVFADPKVQLICVLLNLLEDKLGLIDAKKVAR